MFNSILVTTANKYYFKVIHDLVKVEVLALLMKL